METFRDRRQAVLVEAMKGLSVADQRRLRSTAGVLMKLQRAMERGDESEAADA
jgi:hypothetical protein